jgi:DNA-binding CsgD family transcriptional regulator
MPTSDNLSKSNSVLDSQNQTLSPDTAGLDFNLIDQIASLFAIGPYYYYILNAQNQMMDFVHSGISNVLGIDASTFSLDTLFEIMHPDDASLIEEKELKVSNFFLNEISKSDISKYKMAYVIRLKHKEGHYRTILHQVKALNVSSEGEIQNVIGIHTDITYLNLPIDHSISFISEHKPCYYSVPTEATYILINNSLKKLLTDKEIAVIQKISEGYNSKDIAKTFNVSPLTVNTHKRNILKKSKCKNTAELLVKCIKEGII